MSDFRRARFAARAAEVLRAGRARVRALYRSSQAGASKLPARLDGLERRRLHEILAPGEQIYAIPLENGHSAPAIIRLHWSALIHRYIGVAGAFYVAAVGQPLQALVVIAAGHGVAVAIRMGVSWHTGAVVAVLELAVGVGVYTWLGGGALSTALVAFAIALGFLVMIGWRVNFECITTRERLVRTGGLAITRVTTPTKLADIRLAEVRGPVLGLGWVTFDTISDMDARFHNFGPVVKGESWANLVEGWPPVWEDPNGTETAVNLARQRAAE